MGPRLREDDVVAFQFIVASDAAIPSALPAFARSNAPKSGENVA
jgi:hypothetical protein